MTDNTASKDGIKDQRVDSLRNEKESVAEETGWRDERAISSW